MNTSRNRLTWQPIVFHLPYESPMEDTTTIMSMNNVGRISLSGVQPKYSMIMGENGQLRYTNEHEQGTFMMKLAPTAYFRNLQDFSANEHLTMSIAAQLFKMEAASCGMAYFRNGHPAL